MTDDVEGLISWLRKRAEPNSGIQYEARNAFTDEACTILQGPDATFVAQHFHGANARALADALAALQRERDEAREALGDLLRCEYESAGFGLADCIDNTGKPYQSAHLDKCLKRAEAVTLSRFAIGGGR